MRLLIAIAVLLASCTATRSERYVFLESDAYRCGAAEGLGCGLAVAPVLEQIDQVDGVRESSVSWDGGRFRIEVAPGADRERVASRAAELLESEACCVTESRGKAAAGEPDRWYNSKQTIALSRHEASVIAAGHAPEISAELGLAPAAAAQLHTALREELERAFERAHAAGGGVFRLKEELRAGIPAFEARLATFLTPEQRVRVAAIVARSLDG